MANEADTCRQYVLPKLYAAGWTDDQIREQKHFTDGRIVVAGRKHFRKPGKKADYLLYYKPEFLIGVGSPCPLQPFRGSRTSGDRSARFFMLGSAGFAWPLGFLTEALFQG